MTQILYVDTETYYDKDYSLSKMQTDAYIKDDRFEVIGVSVAVGDDFPKWFSGTEEETMTWLHQFDWANSAACCHHTLFDGFILTQRFGVRPKLWMDTLGMGRRLYPHLPSHSLKALAEHLHIGAKGEDVVNAMGLRREDFAPSHLARYGEYCKNDTALCRGLAKIMMPLTSGLDLKLIDMIVRMFTQPQFVGDAAAMAALYAEEVKRKEDLLQAAGLERVDIMSNGKFAEKLIALGVDVPTKTSKTTGKDAYAFAKTDKEFTALLDHDDPTVRATVAARLGVKTTIAETRVLKMHETALRGPLPVYLNFWGAKVTGRLSGGNDINWQNLPARGPSAGIRHTIGCPPGHSIVVGDSSNIELRVAMAAAGQLDVVRKITAGVDLYCDFASKLFGRTITKADKAERMLGKIAMLSLQYGAGWLRFIEMVRIETTKAGAPMTLTEPISRNVVSLYRSLHSKIMDMHNWCGDSILGDIANGCSLLSVDRNGWCITSNEGFGVHGEPGVRYHNLQMIQRLMPRGLSESVWSYEMGREKVYLFGGKTFENLCQYLAGRIVLWQTARINERFPVALSVHDEAVCVVRDELVDECRAYMDECLSLAPPWCRGQIPLACEIGVGKTYGGAKH